MLGLSGAFAVALPERHRPDIHKSAGAASERESREEERDREMARASLSWASRRKEYWQDRQENSRCLNCCSCTTLRSHAVLSYVIDIWVAPKSIRIWNCGCTKVKAANTVQWVLAPVVWPTSCCETVFRLISKVHTAKTNVMRETHGVSRGNSGFTSSLNGGLKSHELERNCPSSERTKLVGVIDIRHALHEFFRLLVILDHTLALCDLLPLAFLIRPCKSGLVSSVNRHTLYLPSLLRILWVGKIFGSLRGQAAVCAWLVISFDARPPSEMPHDAASRSPPQVFLQLIPVSLGDSVKRPRLPCEGGAWRSLLLGSLPLHHLACCPG